MALQALWDVTQQFQNKNGSILTNGQIYVYYQGRTALATTYHDEDGEVVNSNPIRLDNNGRGTCFASPVYAYTIVVCDFYGKELFSQDITLHDAVAEAEHVFVIGSDGSVLVNTTELPNGRQYDLSANTDILATKEDLTHKKDKQEAYTATGSDKKTITNVIQNENGELTVTYADIDINDSQYTNVRFPFNSNKVAKLAQLPLYTAFQGIGSGRANLELLITDSYGSEAIFSLGIIQGGTSSHMVQPKGVFRYIHPGNGRTTYPIKMIHVRPDNATLPMTTATLYLYAEFDESYNQQADWTFKAIVNEGSVSSSGKVEQAWQFRNTTIAPQADFDQARAWWYLEPSSIETVPNVEITSPNGTIDVQSSVDTSTNTKTFTIDVNSGTVDYYIGYMDETIVPRSTLSGSGVYDIGANLTKREGNLNITQAPGIGKYLFTCNLSVKPETLVNEYNALWFDAQSTSTSDRNRIVAKHNIDFSIDQWTDVQLAGIINIEDASKSLHLGFQVGSVPSTGIKLEVSNVSFYRIESILAGQGGGGGTTYTAGDGIDISSDTISVDAGAGLGFDADHKLEVKVGDGLQIDENNNVITINTEVGDVVETVEKLKRDLDTQITVNFDMPNITHTYDFANRSVTTLANGATMLCQAFTIPINHEIRVQTVAENEPTLLGIYAKQQFGHKIMLALYVYDFETGFTDYVGDTGPVYVQAGRNEYPLVHKNPNITELTSSCVYYASLYLPSTSQSNGLYLASCPSYSDASYINATPRFTVGVENITYNNQEIDMTDATTGRLDYSDGLGNYYIGPWSDSYNERPSAPRFFMQLRNGTAAEPYVPAAPFTTLGASAMPTSSDLGSNLPNFTPSQSNSCFRDVTPEADCDVTYFEWLDDTSSAAGWVQSNCVYNSGFDTNLSGNNNVVTNLGEVTTIGGHSLYRHRLTFGTALHLTANTTYRFLCEAFTDTGYVFSRSNNTNTIHVTNNGWYIDLQNMTRYNSIIGKYIKICADGTDYEL